MIPVFIEAALRSLLVGLAVAIGLRVFRVRNVLAQKAAWGLVLLSALLMPILLPITARWHFVPAQVNVVFPFHPPTLLQELQTRIQANSGPGNAFAALSSPVPQTDLSSTGDSAAPEQSAIQRVAGEPARTARTEGERDIPPIPDNSEPSASKSKMYAAPMQQTQSPAPVRSMNVSPVVLAFSLYFAVAGIFFFRLALGLLATARLWRTATRVPARYLPVDANRLQVRASSRITSPFTIGSTVLLPEDFSTWDSDKLRIVLAHERSHVRQGDFYLQLLAGVYAALVWVSPLGWWLKHELAELAEAISDHAAMEEAASRTSYAQILLEFAAAPRPAPIGIAMARPSSLSRRIERLLNDNSFRQCFAGGRRMLIAVALVPLALLASTMLVRVQAAADPQSPTTRSSTSVAPSVTLVAPTFLAAPQLEALGTVPAAPAFQPGDQAFPQLPLTQALPAVSPEAESLAAPELVATATPAMVIRMAPVVTMIAAGAQDEEGGPSFDRTLSVSGTAQLSVSTGSGNIHIRPASGSQIHIHGQIHVHREGSKEEARQIAANPPIEQNGDTIRVGQHDEQWHDISIDYEIEAPAGTVLTANSGSGDIVDEGVGQNAKLQTGSGDIRATSLEGPFMLKTGSGNITAQQTGQGDVVAETGSGDIELKDIHGTFHGQTGSGNIKASGKPSGAWTLHTGSGNIELWTGDAPLTLEASTGSGSVTTEHEMMMQGTIDHHHIHGTLNGGGPVLRAQTGSGDIQIH